jgi:flagellar hook-basal body complex protein FliE
MSINSILPNVNLPGLTGVQAPVQKPGTTAGAQSPAAPSFSSMLDALSRTQNESDALMAKLAAGEEVELHQVMISAEQTDISFRVAMAIRDKLVEAYHETMRMAV